MTLKPRGYWTKEKCHEESLKYLTINQFKKNCSGAYNISYKNKWLKDITNHMIPKQKPKGYWTKEKCHEESLKYKIISHFEKNSGSAFIISKKQKWLDEICSHMISNQKPNGYWSKEKCQEESLKYNSKSEFQKNSSSAYINSRLNGWLDEICSHMTQLHKPNGYWTKEKCHEESLKYNSKSEFKKNNNSCYSKCVKMNWLSEICSHMISNQKPNGYWTKEKCHKVALQYKCKTDFKNNEYGAYNRSYKSGWINDICSHMIIQNNITKRCIYCYEFPDNSVYVGLTYNIDVRQKNRDIFEKDQVTKHIKETNLQPIRKQLTDYINVNDAIKLEGFYVEKYKNEGWIILNVAKTGGIGGSLRWTYDKCKEESLKYKSKHEFEFFSKGAYESARKNNWLGEICSHMIPKQKPKGYWTYDKCQEESLKYNSKFEFQKNSSSAFNSSYHNGWLIEFYK